MVWNAANLVVTGAIVAALVGGLLLFRSSQGPSTSPSTERGDLLDRVVASGEIRVAVRPDHPQTLVPRGALTGFDVDVAEALAARLGVRSALVFAPADQILAGEPAGTWDVGLPSAAVSSDSTGPVVLGQPTYYWPVRLVVASGSAVRAVPDLANLPICVVTGSSGEAWLDGRFASTSATTPLSPPTPSAIHRLASDADCLADVTSGGASAGVIAALSDAELAVHSTVRALGGPVVTEERLVVARRAGPDSTRMLAAIDQALVEMRADGTLAELSRRRFGGADLSVVPTP